MNSQDTFQASPGLYDKQKRCVAGARGDWSHPSPRVFRDDRRVYVGSGRCLPDKLTVTSKETTYHLRALRGTEVCM